MATEDDKKKTPNPDIQTTTSASSKQNQNSKQHSTQSSIQQGETSGRSYSEWDSNAEQSADAAATRAYTAYGYNQKPDGTIERDQSLFDALGLDRDKLRGEREKQMRLNRWKQIESALFNSGAILSDMISAGIGGNVWKRDKDTTASDAAKDNERLRELQAAEDAAASERERKERQEAYKAAEDARYRELDRLKQNVQEGSSRTRGGSQSDTTTESKSDTTSTQTQNQYMSDAYKAYKSAKGSGRSGAGSKNNKIIKIPYISTDRHGKQSTHTHDIEVDENTYNAMGRYISAVYNNLSSQQKLNVDLVLQNAGIEKNERTGTYSNDDLLAGGVIFEDPDVRNEFEKVILADESLPYQERVAIANVMRTYPVDTEESKNDKEKQEDFFSWLKRLFGNEEANSNMGWGTPSQSNSSTESISVDWE